VQPPTSTSLFRIRLRKFRRIKRGYYSFLLLVGAYLLTFLLPFLMSNRAIMAQYRGTWHFPAFRSYFHDVLGVGSGNIVKASTLGQVEARGLAIASDSEALYRDLKQQYIDDARLIESLSPLGRKRLRGEQLSPSEETSLKNEEAAESKTQAEENMRRLQTALSEVMRKYASGKRLRPTERVQYKEELSGMPATERQAFKKKLEEIRRLAKKHPLARRMAQGTDLSENEREELKQLLLSEETSLQQALGKQLNDSDLDNFVVMPFFDHSPYEKVEGMARAPARPEWPHIMGTDAGGRDIFTRMAYAFRLSITLSLIVVGVAYTFGTLTGAFLGYYGRWLDILGLRVVEVWGAIPFLYTVMILGQIFGKNFLLLCGILAAFGWMSITYLIRGEFYREKSRDYVAAAIATGESNMAIIFKHILPNALTPIITYAPFALVGTISALVALDYLGFGLPASEPSWGQLLRQARDEGLNDWHLIVFPLGAMFITLQLIVFIGEAVREAFDPKVFSRLR